MYFIKHIIEPYRLLLIWQSSEEVHRTRLIIGELNFDGKEVTLTYLKNTKDFNIAKEKGFEGYPAFPLSNDIHHNVLDTFMRRLPPRTRSDFGEYLKGLRLNPDSNLSQLSNFALLGYSGARLLSDDFSIIHPFTNVNQSCEILLEITGFRHLKKEKNISLQIGESAQFLVVNNKIDLTFHKGIEIHIGENLVGYVTRGLIPAFLEFIKDGRILNAVVEKLNGTLERPAAYLYVEISGK